MDLKQVKKETYEEAYQLALRQQGNLAQVKDELEILNSLIQKIGHPYDLWDERNKKIHDGIRNHSGLSTFQRGAQGPKAVYLADDIYIYRFSSFRRMFVSGHGTWSSARMIGSREADQFDYLQFQSSIRLQRHEDPWLRLAEYADGHYSTKRSFTFWTDYLEEVDEIRDDPELVRSQAYQLGIPSDRMSQEMVCLRCKKEGLRESIHIPTAVDAFDQSVFFPVDCTKSAFGQTINLNVFKETLLAERDETDRRRWIHRRLYTKDDVLDRSFFVASEYAIGPVPVGVIEILPFTYTLETETTMTVDALYPLMRSFYAVINQHGPPT
jgi:hypothetical protein